jgi:hypothetical protein
LTIEEAEQIISQKLKNQDLLVLLDSSKPAERAEGIRGFLEEKELLEENGDAIMLFFR